MPRPKSISMLKARRPSQIAADAASALIHEHFPARFIAHLHKWSGRHRHARIGNRQGYTVNGLFRIRTNGLVNNFGAGLRGRSNRR